MTTTIQKPSDIILKIGPIGIARTTKWIQTHRTLPSGESQVFKRLWGYLMYHSRSAGMKCSKPSESDFESIRTLIDKTRENFDLWQGDEMSTQLFMNELDVMLDDADRSQGRVLFGCENLIECGCDPDKDYIDFHPQIHEGLWLRRRFDWLIRLMNFVKFRPWSW